MRLQRILNRVEKFKSFIYGDAHFEDQPGGPVLIVRIRSAKAILDTRAA